MENVQIFNTPAFGEIHIVMRYETPWWVLHEVCRAVEIKNPRDAAARLDDDEKNTVALNDGNRGNPNVTIINESGLYKLLLRSDKPEAKKFTRWVTHEVLPSIRKTGGYIHGAEKMTDMEIVSKAFLISQKTIEQRDARIRELEAENAKMNAQIEADAPSLHFVRSLALSPDATSVGSFAKILNQGDILETGRDRLFATFRERGYLIKDGADKNVPKQHYIEMGLFKIKERTVHDPDGEPRICRQTLVTGKGQVYFAELFLREKAGDSASMDQLPIVGAETETP